MQSERLHLQSTEAWKLSERMCEAYSLHVYRLYGELSQIPAFQPVARRCTDSASPDPV
jgi:hypothetical protein